MPLDACRFQALLRPDGGHDDPRMTFAVYAQCMKLSQIDEAAVWQLMRFLDEPEERGRDRSFGTLTSRAILATAYLSAARTAEAIELVERVLADSGGCSAPSTPHSDPQYGVGRLARHGRGDQSQLLLWTTSERR